MVGYRSALWAVAVLGAAAAQAGTPLRGPAAVEALKQQGSYESLRSAHEAARYQVEPGGQAGSWQARNAAQGLEVEFGSDAVRLRHKDGAVRVRWTGFGYGARMQAPAPAAPVALGNRVEYRRGAQREWYVNEGRGFEQGFTLAERPAPGAPGQPLVLTLEMSGDLRPEAIAATGEVRLVAGQTTVLRYEGLKSWDARGRPMPSRMEVEGRQVRLVVEDGQAEYPLTIDPAFTQQVKLTGADGTAGDYFGISVALSGDTALVGASGDDGLKGSAYVFVRSGSGWSQQQKLTASDGATGDLFGRSVALSRDTALVGAAQDDTNKGSAYVFVRNGTVWTEQQKLAASDGTSGDYFGISVALSADTALVGAFGDDTNKGAAYVFVRAGTSWSQQQKLTASAGLAGDYLGNSVALDGDTALVGANSDASGKGAAYVFVRAGTSWSQQQKLTSSDIATGDFFGTSVALSGNAALVGSPGGGSAYTFLRGGTAWSQQQKLTASDASIGDQFGAAVALSGNIAFIGAVGDDNGKGSAYAFVRGGAFWTEQQKLTAADGVAADFFGHAVALSGNTALAGAYGDDSIKGSAYIIGIAEAKLTASDGVSGDDFGINVALSGDTALVGAVGDDAARGSAYVFVRSGGAWAQQQKLTAADAAVNDWFGGAVALSGDTALIGAVGDDASKGSAYVFTRTGGVWSQQQKLTAADGVANDWFGVSVAVSGDTALIGAYGDDSQKGSAYVFIRSGSTWSLQQKLTAADGVASDWFGAAVALSGETALIGAYGDDSQKGSAYVFLRTGGTWNLQQKLAASDGVITDWFGISVALYGDTALIAALGDDLQRGSAYLFQRTGSTWSQQQKLTASDGVAGDYFGRSVALTGDAALIGADRDDSFAGSAYAFTRNGSTWGDEQKLRAPDGAAGDHFGYSVALGQNAALASAYLDDTSRGSVYVLYPIGTQAPSLVVAKTHIGDFAQGQSNATYTVTVHNASSTLPTSGTVTVTENLPPGLTLVGMAGAPWWNCIGNTCTRGDALAAGATYQPITVTVNVAGNATSPQVNTVTVSGGGSSSATATDATVILGNNPVPAIASLSPGSTNYGGPAFTLTVNGSGFVPGSEARWNGSARPTTYLSASQVQAAIAAADIAASGTALVTVFNPAPVGGLSNAVSFTFTQTGTNKAEITSPAPGSTLPSSVTFQWTAGVNVTAYQLSLSHVPGQAELYNQYLGPAQSATVTGLACDGLATYVRLWSLIGGAWQFNDYTYTACSGAKGAISSPAPGSTLTSSSQLFQWAAVPGVAAYQLSVSSVAGQAELYNQYVGAALSANATGLPTDGRTLYVRLWSLINGAWQFNDYTYTAASLAATMISPTPGTAFLSATVTFQWAPGTGVAAYQLSISRVAWQAELYNQYLGSALTATATNLPCDGSVLYVRLWSLISGAWQYNNYTYQACSATKAAMTSPTPTTQLAPTTQLFQWSAGSGVSAYQLSISSVFGQAELYNQYLAGALSANVTGLPSDGRTLYVRLWSLIGGAWQFNDYVYNASGGIKAAILSPTPGTQLGSPSALFQWSAGSGVAAYQLSISRVAGQAEVYNQYLGSALSVTATGLPTGGGPLYVRIWSLMSGAWQFNDYIYTAAP